MKCTQVGLVGFGFAGRIFHSNAIEAVEGLELAAIVQRSSSDAALAFPHAKILPTVEDLLKDTSIRLVVVDAQRYPSSDRPAMPAGRPGCGDR